MTHDFTDRQIRMIRFERARFKRSYEKLAQKYRSTAPVIALVCEGVIGAADDQNVELRFRPPPMTDPKELRKKPKRCTNGHLYFGKSCFSCYIQQLPRPDAEAAEV